MAPSFPRTRDPLHLLAGLAAALSLAVYAALALIRVPHPFELEWMEGGSVSHVARLVAGKSIYGPPTLEFIPYVYPPLYYLVAAVPTHFLGLGLLPLRLVSLSATLVTLGILADWLRRETGSWTSGLVGAGLFAACFRFAGAWFDIARVDTLFLALCWTAGYCLRFAPPAWAGPGAAACVTLAFLTKQSGLGLAVLMALAAAARGRRVFGGYVVSAPVGLAASFGLMQWLTDGWFAYYCFELPAHHRMIPRMLTSFWVDDFLPHLGPGLGLAVLHLSALARRRELSRAWFHFIWGGSLIGMSWLSVLKAGGYDNLYLPAASAIAWLAALGLHEARPRETGRPQARRWLALAFSAIVLLQFALLAYDPRDQRPGRWDRRAGNELLALIRSIDGPVILPFHGDLARRAGKPPFPNMVAIHDLTRGDPGPVGQGVHASVQEAIAEHRFAAVIVDSNWFPGELSQYYVRAQRIFSRDDVFWPVTGRPVRPEWLYLPRDKE